MECKWTFLCLCAVICISFVSSSYGWGDDGHQIVAQVANAYLTSTTQQQTSKILGSYNMTDVATWPDNYDHTSEGEWSGHLHYVNLNQSDLVFTYKACQPPLADPPGCVIAAIDNFTAILVEDYQRGTYQACNDPNGEPCPLSFLIHFLGDSHQPLHVAYQIDEGGNTYDVDYYGDCTELHSVWDSRLIYTYEDDNDIGWSQMGNQIIHWLGDNPNIVTDFTNATKPAQWGSETFAACRFAPYNMSPGTVPPASNWIHTIYGYITPQMKKTQKMERRSSSCDGIVLPDNYYEKNIPVVFDQLAKAGIRLAYQLNTIYDPNFHGF